VFGLSVVDKQLYEGFGVYVKEVSYRSA
jgi:hypothetical protein